MLNSTKSLVVAILTGSVLSLSQPAFSADTADQTINMTVPAVNEITVSGPATLTLVTPVAGADFADATDASTTYGVTTNETGRKITGQLDAAMPTGLTLFVTLAAPASAGGAGTSVGEVDVTDATIKDLVTGMATVNDAASTIAYRLAALATATPGTPTRTMTFTVTADN